MKKTIIFANYSWVTFGGGSPGGFAIIFGSLILVRLHLPVINLELLLISPPGASIVYKNYLHTAQPNQLEIKTLPGTLKYYVF